MIKYIIFDLGEVLISGARQAGLNLGEKYNIDRHTDSRAKNFSFYKEPHPLIVPLIDEFFTGKVTEEEYLKQVIETYPEVGNIEEVKKHIREHFVEVEGTRDIILKLRKLGYKIGLLSIHGKEWIEYCEKQFDFHKMFDAIAYSYEDGVQKPDPESFKLIMQRFDAKPEDCIFIDDFDVNVQAAEKLGMKGVVFTSAADLHTILEQLLDNYKS